MLALEGPMVAMATPFSQGKLDEEAYRRHCQFLIENGITGLVPMGTTGEAVTCTPSERLRAIRIAVEEAAKSGTTVIGGAGTNSTAEVIEAVRGAREVGAHAALIVTPYYNKPTQDGLVAHYQAIARAHPGFPLVAYNVPGRTGVDLLPETCGRLCEIPEILGLKEATGSMVRSVDLVERCSDRLALLSGDDFTIAPFLAVGGRGAISVSGNIAPRWIADLVQAAMANDCQRALGIQVKLNALHRALFAESNPIPVKAALHMMGRFEDDVRLPLTPLSPAGRARLEPAMRSLGLLELRS